MEMNKQSWKKIDEEIVNIMEEEGIEFICGLPCQMLSGIINCLEASRIIYIPVTREEEGVGICAGFHLGGRKAVLLMQNSGLGNSINALLSLIRLYEMPLLMLLSHRGSSGEKIAAQVPMGQATPKLLEVLGIEYLQIARKEDLAIFRRAIQGVFKKNEIKAFLLSRSLWDEED